MNRPDAVRAIVDAVTARNAAHKRLHWELRTHEGTREDRRAALVTEIAELESCRGATVDEIGEALVVVNTTEPDNRCRRGTKAGASRHAEFDGGADPTDAPRRRLAALDAPTRPEVVDALFEAYIARIHASRAVTVACGTYHAGGWRRGDDRQEYVRREKDAEAALDALARETGATLAELGAVIGRVSEEFREPLYMALGWFDRVASGAQSE